jgi:glycosyltransferase involved in cell wall biosynthesis/exopolysaccharide biosynthesis predicted pyruvyltransferase EpsI
MADPLISIIVPVYNVEKYLRRCLDSIITQTLRNIEIICVNDGTKDNSVLILDEYAAKDERIKIIHKENGGLSSARNEGIKYATADYIGFVDSDDWVEPDTYELAYKAMMRNNVDLVCWYAQIEIEDGLSFDDNEMRTTRDYYKINNTGYFIVSDDTFLNCAVTAWNKLYKRDIIEKYQLSFPYGLLHEDVEFFFKYIQLCKSVFFIDKYLTHYMQRSGSIMHDESKKKRVSIDRIKIMENIYLFSVKHDTVLKYPKTISKALIWDCFISNCFANSKKNQLFIYRYAADIVKEMDLTLFEDPNNILFNLKHRKYSKLFYFFNNESLKDYMIKRTIIYRILRKIYHQTSYYKIKILQQKYDDMNNRLKERSNTLDETRRWLKERSDILDNTNHRLEQKSLVLNRVIINQIEAALDEMYIKNNTDIYTNKIIKMCETMNYRTNSLKLQEKAVIDELKKLDEFIFFPNNGNLGDVIIAEAEYQLFASLGLKYKILNLYNDNNTDEQLLCHDYVYGGGGLFCGFHYYENVMKIFKSKKLKKIIILPSSFYQCEDLLETLDERFIVFCREEQSFNYCLSMNKKAKFIMAHDMAFSMEYKQFAQNWNIITNAIQKYNKKYSKLLYESYCYFMITGNNIKRAIDEKVTKLRNGLKLGIMLRTDIESNLSEDGKGRYMEASLDLSSFGWISCTDAGLVKALSFLFIMSLNYFDIIITDRLHIGITSAILGKKVYMLDNSYGKLSGVYRQSMQDFDNVRMINSFSEFEREIDGFFAEKQSKTETLFDFNITFHEFLAIYFSAYNPENIVTKTFLNEIIGDTD